MRPFKSRAASVGRERCRYVARRFGQELRLARMAAGLTQAQVAARADVSQTVVSEAERGHTDISLEARCRLTAACGYELGLKLYGRDSLAAGFRSARDRTGHLHCRTPTMDG